MLWPAFNQTILIGLSPLTAQCNIAESPFLTDNEYDDWEKYGGAENIKYLLS